MYDIYFVSELHNYKKGKIICWPPKYLGKKVKVPHEWENLDNEDYVKYGNYFSTIEDAQHYYEKVNNMKLRTLAA